MRAVGLKVLKNKLSEYVRLAASGETVLVTDRDRVVAELDESAAVVVNVGDLGYWPTGRAFCIFFGLTPGSVPGEIRPASAVNLVGRVTDDPCCLKLAPEGAPVRIEKK